MDMRKFAGAVCRGQGKADEADAPTMAESLATADVLLDGAISKLIHGAKEGVVRKRLRLLLAGAAAHEMRGAIESGLRVLQKDLNAPEA